VQNETVFHATARCFFNFWMKLHVAGKTLGKCMGGVEMGEFPAQRMDDFHFLPDKVKHGV